MEEKWDDNDKRRADDGHDGHDGVHRRSPHPSSSSLLSPVLCSPSPSKQLEQQEQQEQQQQQQESGKKPSMSELPSESLCSEGETLLFKPYALFALGSPGEDAYKRAAYTARLLYTIFIL